MDLETRVANLENLVGALIKRIDNDKFYTSADINGARVSADNGIDRNSADIDYLAMMTDVDIPTED